MSDLNLLPSKRQSKFSFVETGHLLRRAAFILASIFFVMFLAFALLIFFNQRKIDYLKNKQYSLSNDLKKFSKTEVEYNFIKDRVEKASVVLSSRNVLKRAEDLRLLLDKISYGNLEELDIDKTTMSFSLVVFSYQDLLQFLSAIKGNQNYKNVTINSLEFSPGTGYKLQMYLKI